MIKTFSNLSYAETLALCFLNNSTREIKRKHGNLLSFLLNTRVIGEYIKDLAQLSLSEGAMLSERQYPQYNIAVVTELVNSSKSFSSDEEVLDWFSMIFMAIDKVRGCKNKISTTSSLLTSLAKKYTKETKGVLREDFLRFLNRTDSGVKKNYNIVVLCNILHSAGKSKEEIFEWLIPFFRSIEVRKLTKKEQKDKDAKEAIQIGIRSFSRKKYVLSWS